MCDANERLDLPTAVWLGNKLAEFDIFWFEEPVVSDDVAAHLVPDRPGHGVRFTDATWDRYRTA